MPSKRRVLEALNRGELLAIVDRFVLHVLAQLIDELRPPQLLRHLGLDVALIGE